MPSKLLMQPVHQPRVADVRNLVVLIRRPARCGEALNRDLSNKTTMAEGDPRSNRAPLIAEFDIQDRSAHNS